MSDYHYFLCQAKNIAFNELRIRIPFIKIYKLKKNFFPSKKHFLVNKRFFIFRKHKKSKVELH